MLGLTKAFVLQHYVVLISLPCHNQRNEQGMSDGLKQAKIPGAMATAKGGSEYATSMHTLAPLASQGRGFKDTKIRR